MAQANKSHDRLNLMQVTQQSTYAEDAKPHLHILMTQMSVKAGIKKFGKKAMRQFQKNNTSYMAERQWFQYAKMTCPQKIGKRHYDT